MRGGQSCTLTVAITVALLHNGISEQHLQSPAWTCSAACPLRYTRATEAVRDAAPSTRMPARTQLAGMWLNSHCSCKHHTQSTADSSYLERKDSKNPCWKSSISGYCCLVFMRNKKRDVFPVSESNFPLSLASSHARLLPPACAPSPQSQEGRNKQQTVLQPLLETGCPGNS